MASRIIRKPPTTRTPRPVAGGPVSYHYNDPTTPKLFDRVTPPEKTRLPVAVTGYVGGGYPADSSAGQAASCLVTIANSLDYVGSRTKRPLTKWAAGGTLKVVPRAGKDLNAFYNRRSLQFFYDNDPILKKTVFTCDSTEVVAHELGHAILDIMRPDMWNVQSMEVWAFHEAYGDCNSIMTMLSQDKVLEHVLNETDGDIAKSNVVSKIAEQIGLAVYHTVGNKGRSKEYLRNAVNAFKYVEPEKLPKETLDDQLSGECHNFSRVWTGAWYDFMNIVYDKHKKDMGPKKALVTARDVAAKYLLHAVNDVPLTARLFDALARQMLVIDGNDGRPYRDELLWAFKKRNILRNEVSMLSVGKKTGKSRRLKLADHIGVTALSHNPLYYVNIDVSDDIDGIDSAMECVDYLHTRNLVGKGSNTPFEIKDGRLIRSHVMCGCNSGRNDCDPNAPEYGKGYKPQNNGGCCGPGKARTCECKGTEPTPRKKLGCYTTVRGGSLARYRNGYNTSRKVC